MVELIMGLAILCSGYYLGFKLGFKDGKKSAKGEVDRLKSELVIEKKLHKSMSISTPTGPVVISGQN